MLVVERVCCRRRRSGEIFLHVTAREITKADAARKWHVDGSTVISTRRTVTELHALNVGGPAREE